MKVLSHFIFLFAVINNSVDNKYIAMTGRDHTNNGDTKGNIKYMNAGITEISYLKLFMRIHAHLLFLS